MARGHDVGFATGIYGGYQAILWDAKIKSIEVLLKAEKMDKSVDTKMSDVFTQIILNPPPFFWVFKYLNFSFFLKFKICTIKNRSIYICLPNDSMLI
ncbi:MAG: hypothetical protein CM15mP59_2550 [Flavobacteriaceae bacterium]|nr:MAG: hypothetical protein CM15mP59_2550 [Flavobacteriaceae bacterium]